MSTWEPDGTGLRRLSGATARRVIDPSYAEVPEHAHDWPVLSLYLLGAYRNRSELGDVVLNAPSVVLYRGGSAHANRAGPDGFEQVEIEFDPAWLGRERRLPDWPLRRCVGGAPAAAARALARLWASPQADEDRLRAATCRLLQLMQDAPEARRAGWLDGVGARIRERPELEVAALAAEAGLHRSWLGQAYHAATGETVRETATRRRVEIAARLLRETSTTAAEAALDAGFCDQSHMSRAFRRVLGRTPGEVRAERAQFRALQTSNP